MKIWIDAGHGGTASGSTYGTRQEKNDALRFALELERQFQAQGCETVMTRRTDTQLTKGTDNGRELSARAKLERDNKCDLAISCHRNAATVDARGFEVWIHHAPAQSVVQWAANVAQGIATAGMPLRKGTVADGVYTGYRDNPNLDYAVNRETNSPSMMLELGFITSDADNAAFDAHMVDYCAAVVKASCAFLGIAYIAPGGTEKPTPPTDTTDYKALYTETYKKLLEWQGRAEDATKRADDAESCAKATKKALEDIRTLAAKYSA